MTDQPDTSDVPTLERSEAGKVRLQHVYDLLRDQALASAQVRAVVLRSLLLVNGGAIVGLLTFLGNVNKSIGKAGASAAVHLHNAFEWFLAGVISSLAALVVVWFAQENYESLKEFDNHGLVFRLLALQPPRALNSLTRGLRSAHVALIVLAVAAVIFSVVAFAMGSFAALDALAPLAAS